MDPLGYIYKFMSLIQFRSIMFSWVSQVFFIVGTIPILVSKVSRSTSSELIGLTISWVKIAIFKNQELIPKLISCIKKKKCIHTYIDVQLDQSYAFSNIFGDPIQLYA